MVGFGLYRRGSRPVTKFWMKVKTKADFAGSPGWQTGARWTRSRPAWRQSRGRQIGAENETSFADALAFTNRVGAVADGEGSCLPH